MLFQVTPHSELTVWSEDEWDDFIFQVENRLFLIKVSAFNRGFFNKVNSWLLLVKSLKGANVNLKVEDHLELHEQFKCLNINSLNA